jgi:hypothetical protein
VQTTIRTLTPQQLTAVDLLASGKNITETATAIDVGRPTVSAWLHHNPEFAAELSRRRKQVWSSHNQRLRGLVPKAMDVLEHLVTSQKDVSAAVHILKCAGIYGIPSTSLPFSEEEEFVEPGPAIIVAEPEPVVSHHETSW